MHACLRTVGCAAQRPGQFPWAWLVCVILGSRMLGAGLAQASDNWPQFRGPAGNGVIESLTFPIEWSTDKNIAWRATLPGAGWSSPVVMDGLVFVTTAAGEGLGKPLEKRDSASDSRSTPFGSGKPPAITARFELHCLDLATGKIVWSRVVDEMQPKLPIHPSNTYATETPVADGERVYVYFGASGTVACYDRAGEQLWKSQVEVLPVMMGYGTGASLALVDGKVLLQQDNDKQSALVAFDARSGAEQWRVTRPGKTSWSTPLVWRNRVRTEVVAGGTGAIISYDPASGSELWRLGGVPASTTATPTATGDMVYIGNSSPFSTSPMYAVKCGATGDISLPFGAKSNEFVAWCERNSGVNMSSPVVYEGLLYVPQDGILRVFDASTGKSVYKSRVPGAKQFVASPWAGDGKVFLLDESGATFVVKAGAEFVLLGTNKLDDMFWSTPAVAGESLLLRGVDGLYCVRAVAP